MDAEIKFCVAGAIHSPEAYALAKMLDHSGWRGQCVRRITPSDIDLALDNDGSIMFVELSSYAQEWSQIQKGQRLLYQNFIKDRLHCAVLCRHGVVPQDGRKINTWTDIESFQVMIWDHEPVVSKILEGAELWQRFVRHWCNRPQGPLSVHREIIGADVVRRRPQPTVTQKVVPITAGEAIRQGSVFEFITGKPLK